jgi:hypothetical protein
MTTLWASAQLRFCGNPIVINEVRDNVIGDWSEIFNAVIIPICGVLGARYWYWRQVVSSSRLFFRFHENPQAAWGSWKGQIHMYMPMHAVVAHHPGISMRHIPVESNLPSLLFVMKTIFLFGVGIPAFLERLVFSGMLGILASGIMLYSHKHYALIIQTLDLHKRVLAIYTTPDIGVLEKGGAQDGKMPKKHGKAYRQKSLRVYKLTLRKRIGNDLNNKGLF